MYKCVLATVEDVEWIATIAAKRMLEEELNKPQYYSFQTVANLIMVGISSETVWVAYKDNLKVGALGALIVPNPFNPKITTLTEVFWWVDPEHRTGKAALQLLTKFVTKSNEFDEATFSLLNHSNVVAKALEKRGFKSREYGFHKER
jgi:hypothetical protein